MAREHSLEAPKINGSIATAQCSCGHVVSGLVGIPELTEAFERACYEHIEGRPAASAEVLDHQDRADREEVRRRVSDLLHVEVPPQLVTEALRNA